MIEKMSTNNLDPSPGEFAADESAGVAAGISAGVSAEITGQLEAILIIAESPVSALNLAVALDQPIEVVNKALTALQNDYNGNGINGQPSRRRGFELREIAGGFRFYARQTHDELISAFVHQDAPTKLSQAALETLAVIAYKQPVTRGQVAAIRAVNVDGVVRTLVSRGLVTEVGTHQETGAILYGTTELLLEQLGINSLEELPPMAPLLDDGGEGFDGEY